LVRQLCTEITVKFEDAAVADYFDDQVDHGRVPEEFARIWIHTHPGSSPFPSSTDEETFTRSFGQADWAIMFILARGGRTYARMRFCAGPGGEVVLPVEVDFGRPFAASAANTWEAEYHASVTIEPVWFEGTRAIPARDSQMELSHRDDWLWPAYAFDVPPSFWPREPCDEPIF
jgi:hypothetical protein